jgi:hypothetical protein
MQARAFERRQDGGDQAALTQKQVRPARFFLAGEGRQVGRPLSDLAIESKLRGVTS